MHSTVEIHPTAVVATSAVLGEGTSVGPFCVVGEKVILGKNNRIISHVVIDGNTQIGDDNTFYQFSSIGAAPQDLKFHGEDSNLIIGNSNIIREYVTLQPGTEAGGMTTNIGSSNLFMACSHVGHDSQVGNYCWFANSVALAGHVTVGSYVIVGGLSGVHQFARLGDHCMIGAGSMVTKDVPPYFNAQGDRAGLVGVNKIGLERRGFNGTEITEIEKTYRILFYGEGLFSERVQMLSDVVESDKLKALLDFINTSQRGICFPRKKTNDQE